MDVRVAILQRSQLAPDFQLKGETVHSVSELLLCIRLANGFREVSREPFCHCAGIRRNIDLATLKIRAERFSNASRGIPCRSLLSRASQIAPRRCSILRWTTGELAAIKGGLSHGPFLALGMCGRKDTLDHLLRLRVWVRRGGR